MWNEETEAQLLELTGAKRPVTQETVATVAAEMEISPRSVSSKLRKMGVEVDKVTPPGRKFTEAQEAELRDFLESNSGEFTYAEIAEQVAGGEFTAKQVQGKILSMELTDNVKPTPKKEATRTYTDEEQETFLKLARSGAYIEDIAEALGKSVNSVRGKALSLNRSHDLDIPPTRNKAETVDPFEALGEKRLEMTVAEIAEAIGKSERGVKGMITRRNAPCADYKPKASKSAAA